jgi:two-component system CheB/CheR fusion protein
VIDRKGRLVAANVRAETLFNLRPRDVGRPFQDLEVSYRPVELRSVIDEVTTGQRPAELTDVVWHRAPGAEPSVYDVNVVPLYRYTDEPVGVGVSFLDVTKYRQLREELERSNHDLEQAYEELQSTNEELETTNEELQSTNEELETMNEELQSTNDELQMINDVLRLRGEELDTTKAFAASTLRSLGSTVVVVDTDLRVQVWGPGAEDLWGLRSDEATGRAFGDLDIGLPVKDVVPMLERTLAGEQGRTEVVVDAMNRRGRHLSMVLERLLLQDDEGNRRGVIVVMNAAAEQT